MKFETKIFEMNLLDYFNKIDLTKTYFIESCFQNHLITELASPFSLHQFYLTIVRLPGKKNRLRQVVSSQMWDP